MDISRRGLLLGGLAFIATAPAIVRPGLIMPIKPSLVPVYDLLPGGLRHWKLDGRTPVPCDLFEWARFFENADRFLGHYEEAGKGRVSTVFLGLDHGFDFGDSPGYRPVLFESMVFGGPHDGEMRRYCTYDEAEKGHQEMVKQVKE